MTWSMRPGSRWTTPSLSRSTTPDPWSHRAARPHLIAVVTGRRAAPGRALARALEPGHVQQAEDAQADPGDAGPDPPAVTRRDLRPDREQHDKRHRPPGRDHGRDQLIVGLQRRRGRAAGIAHVFQGNLAPLA